MPDGMAVRICIRGVGAHVYIGDRVFWSRTLSSGKKINLSARIARIKVEEKPQGLSSTVQTQVLLFDNTDNLIPIPDIIQINNVRVGGDIANPNKVTMNIKVTPDIYD